MSQSHSPAADAPSMPSADHSTYAGEKTTTAAAPVARRQKLFALLGAVIVLAGLAYGGYWYFIGSRYVSTDNAYTAAEIASITPSVSGIVQRVAAVDTQHVRKGDVLVVIDDTDAKLALEQAEAEVGRAERKVRGYLATDAGLAAQVAARAADEARMNAQIASAKADFDRAAIDLKRREALAHSGSVSGEELSNAQTSFASAQAALMAARANALQAQASRAAAIGSQDANKVLFADTTVDTNPEVLLARAKRDQARVDLQRTVLRAPVDGVVARRQVQVGQRVEPGASLLSVVPVDSLHVDANFKEVQLDKVRIGQPVELTSDLYGGKVVYHGKVAGLAGGAGSAFAMIPAQNATGNWIKVVQRLPVRVAIDPADLRAHPLGVGLSMEATVDTRDGGVDNATPAS
ncbi:HlyD family secretion protein [Paraburkholderia terricola]|uniref:Membrane fusion protein (Multidrug efflux system) n=1 Tax=Paraburkholderia terricola TaxID=169427 RepID=A0ABU1LJX9_9BURK|nr:HlyD family secretion protein [Paraburkholderia terricola]MDR6407041.1 membrane fusion protein (multidrug efflux system) [Paraburkholderia terricola]MDR6479280.1 membrane fusion protein (multidrug efflux system) [Paraburkholderia terricola]